MAWDYINMRLLGARTQLMKQRLLGAHQTCHYNDRRTHRAPCNGYAELPSKRDDSVTCTLLSLRTFASCRNRW